MLNVSFAEGEVEQLREIALNHPHPFVQLYIRIFLSGYFRPFFRFASGPSLWLITPQTQLTLGKPLACTSKRFRSCAQRLIPIDWNIFCSFGFQMIVATPLKSVMTLEPFVGGACFVDISERRHSRLPVKRVFIVENLQTFLAFQELPDSLVIMGRGYSVSLLRDFHWISETECFYCGDIDTHGLAILSQARLCFPKLCSILMDDDTLLRHRAFCVEEQSQHSAENLPGLTSEEQALYRSL